jgi:hypothetical protein
VSRPSPRSACRTLTLFIAPSALGPLLIRIEPVVRDGVRAATVVAEQSLGTLEALPG